jgi:polyisoprenyl-phosphate glycosyltransferase
MKTDAPPQTSEAPAEMQPALSIVIPVYQNELNLADSYQALSGVLDALPPDFAAEFIFVNDGSTDNSYAELMKIQTQSRRPVTVVDLWRNFGQVAALFAGYRAARGRTVVTISADLQDPPELILEMVKAWQHGEKLVLAVRADREEGWFRKWTSWGFYAAMRKFAIATMPTGGFDYFLMDRQLLDMMLSINERNVFLQGQALWPGVKPYEIPYMRRPRLKGRSQWKLSRKLSYFLDGFTAYSAFPLRLAAWAGAGFCVLACLISVLLVIQRIVYGTSLVGWTSLMIVMLMIGGIQMLTIGILGEYLWRTLEQTRIRPMYLVRQILTSPRPDQS